MKSTKSTKNKDHGRFILKTFPSWFGSHSEMIQEVLDDEFVLCKDEIGVYKTYKNRIDNGLADPLRFSRRSR